MKYKGFINTSLILITSSTVTLFCIPNHVIKNIILPAVLLITTVQLMQVVSCPHLIHHLILLKLPLLIILQFTVVLASNLFHSSFIITNSSYLKNSATVGGVIFVFNCNSVTIANAMFTKNSAVCGASAENDGDCWTDQWLYLLCQHRSC